MTTINCKSTLLFIAMVSLLSGKYFEDNKTSVLFILWYETKCFCRPDSLQGNIIHYVFTVIGLKLCNLLCSINNNTEQGELWNTLCFLKSSYYGKRQAVCPNECM